MDLYSRKHRPDGKKTKLCPVCENKYIPYEEDCCAECGRPRKNPNIDWNKFLIYREKINYENEHGYLVLDDEHRFVGIAFCEKSEGSLDDGMTLVRFFDWFASDFCKWGQLLYKYDRCYSNGFTELDEFDPVLIGRYLPLPYNKLEHSMPQRTVDFLPWSTSALGFMQIVRCDGN